MAAQSASAQQLPGVQLPPQQKSLVLAAQGPLAVQAELTQVPEVGMPVVVLQIFVEPYLISSSVYPGLADNWSLNQLAYSFAFQSANLGASAALSLMLLVVCIVAALIAIFRTDFFDDAKPTARRTRRATRRAGLPAGSAI